METNNIYVHVRGLGFTFLLDKRMKHNLISPTFLALFKIDKQRDSLLNNDIGEVNIKPEYNSSLPFLPSYVNSISLEDTFHYVGKKVVWCSDNKFRSVRQSNSILNMRDTLTLNYSLWIRVLKRTMLF